MHCQGCTSDDGVKNQYTRRARNGLLKKEERILKVGIGSGEYPRRGRMEERRMTRKR